MMRLVHEWNADLAGRKPGQNFTWPASNIRGFRFVEDTETGASQREWTIHELLTSADLYLEGRALRHCVYTYAAMCRRGETTIWSLRLRDNGREKRIATIEMDPRKGEIIEARTKANNCAGSRSQEMIRQWAALAGLQVNELCW
jgi:hypothetical protein